MKLFKYCIKFCLGSTLLAAATLAPAAQLSTDARGAIPHDVQQLVVIDYRAMQNSILQYFATKALDRPLSPRELLRARKIVYIGLILVLFTASLMYRRILVEPQAENLQLR